MPVQINEIIIRTVVEQSPASPPASAPAVASVQPSNETEIAALILEIIKEKNER
jgi:hypothetical protein